MLRKLFPKNIGTFGRLLRLTLAVLLIVYAFSTKSLLAFLGALFVLFEVLMSWCVVLHFFGKTSCSIDNQKNSKK
jgi:predicted permease